MPLEVGNEQGGADGRETNRNETVPVSQRAVLHVDIPTEYYFSEGGLVYLYIFASITCGKVPICLPPPPQMTARHAWRDGWLVVGSCCLSESEWFFINRICQKLGLLANLAVWNSRASSSAPTDQIPRRRQDPPTSGPVCDRCRHGKDGSCRRDVHSLRFHFIYFLQPKDVNVQSSNGRVSID